MVDIPPDIIAAIIDETLQEGVQLLSLAINLPMLWEDQRRWRVAMVNGGPGPDANILKTGGWKNVRCM